VIKCIEEAKKEGDLEITGMPPEYIFWYIHHLFMSLKLLSSQVILLFEYNGTEKDLERITAIIFVCYVA